MPVSTDGVRVLIGFYADPSITSEDSLELVREVCAQVCQTCGVWSATRPLADLGVALTQARAAHFADCGGTHYQPDPRIDEKSLLASPYKLALSELAADSGRRDRLLGQLRVAQDNLCTWMWHDLLENSLYDNLFEASLVIKDCQFMLEGSCASNV